MLKTKNKQCIMSKFIVVAISFMATAHGMVPLRLYRPIIHKPNMQHDELRRLLWSDDIKPNHTSYTIVGNHKRGVCFDYAFMHIFQITEPLKITDGQVWITELNALRFFDQIEKPQKNCLVAYTCKEDRVIQHVGMVINDDINNIQVRSKWGAREPIIEGPLFNLPSNWGDAAYFFQLKEKYAQGIDGKKLILQKIHKNIDQAKEMKERFAELQHDFNRLADGKKPLSCDCLPVDHLTPLLMTKILLKRMPGIDINCLNEKENTPLISAIKRRDIDMVKLLVEHGANKNACDMWGTSAIQLARTNDDEEIVQVLRRKRIRVLY